MAEAKGMNWLAYRRRRWLVGFGVALGVVLGWLFLGGGSPEIVLYNNSPRPLGAVRLEVGGTVLDFPPLAPGESAVRAPGLRVGGEIGLWLPGDPPQRIAGPWVEPAETAQVVVRIDEYGEVIFSQLPTWRSRLVAALR